MASVVLIDIMVSNFLSDLYIGVDFVFSTSQINSSGMKNIMKQNSESKFCSMILAPLRTNAQLPFCKSYDP